MKKQLSFSKVTVLSLVLLPTMSLFGSEQPKEATAQPSRQEAATRSQAPESSGWGISNLLASLTGGSSAQATPQQPTGATLSHDLKNRAEALFALRRLHLETLKKIAEDQNLALYEQIKRFSATAESLGENPEQFIPAVVKNIEDKLLELRRLEDAAARSALDKSLELGNFTRQERGRVTCAMRNAGQTKTSLREDSPNLTIEEYGKRLGQNNFEQLLTSQQGQKQEQPKKSKSAKA